VADKESGPFCCHWVEPWECDDKCVCGHRCSDHDRWSQDHDCDVDGCDCEQFEDETADEKPPGEER